jgi:hypothetical protein
MRRGDPVAGTHDQHRWLWVPALAALGRDDDGLVRANNQPAAVGIERRLRSIVLGLLFTMDGATPTCRAVSARGFRPCPGRCWLTRSGVASGAIRPTKPGARRRLQFAQGRQGRPPLQIPMSFDGPACVILRAQRKPPAGCPAGGRQLKSSREHQGTMSRWTRMRSP